MEILEQAEQAARVLSQQQYQGYSRWCIELNYSRSFEAGEAEEPTQSIQVVAMTGGLGRLRLTLDEAIAAAGLAESL